MTIEEAIEARYARFDRMYQKAVGHTFREDPAWCEEQTKKEMEEWQPKMDALLKDRGFKSEDDYWNYLTDPDMEHSDEEFRSLYREKPCYSSLFSYEELCINQAKAIIDFLATKNNDLKIAYNTYFPEGSNMFGCVRNLQKDGFTAWDEGHSVNSVGQSLLFVSTLCNHPDWFPYLHGASTPLVGDEGYHDTRDDLPESLQ